MPRDIAGARKKYVDNSRFNQSIDENALTRGATPFDSMVIRKMSTEEMTKTAGKAFPLVLSASFPPIQLPRDKPSRVIPITDVQVYTEPPMIGAMILEEMTSTVITEKPETNAAKMYGDWRKYLFIKAKPAVRYLVIMMNLALATPQHRAPLP